jgi:hypothetical protein
LPKRNLKPIPKMESRSEFKLVATENLFPVPVAVISGEPCVITEDE